MRLRARTAAPAGLVAGALLVAMLLAAPSPALAGEQEVVVAPSLAYSVFRINKGGALGTDDHHGGTLYLDIDYGLTDSWALRGTAHYALHRARGAVDPLLHFGSFGFGILYTFDVLKVVPYASLTIGPHYLTGGDVDPRWNASIQVGFGMDYLVSRDFSVGVELRYHLLVPDVNTYPMFLGVAVRLAWRRQ